MEDGHCKSYMCRGTSPLYKGDFEVEKRRYESTYKIPIVALGCAPYHYLMCNQEYNYDQIMESTCICHPLYSVENNDTYNGMIGMEPQCLPMAGVPCEFDKSEGTDFSELLLHEVKCAPNMVCKKIKDINHERKQNKSVWELFEHSFTGFGMSPIARDYMVSKAIGMCVCNKTEDAHGKMVEKYIQTPFNECLEPRKSKGEMIHFGRKGGWIKDEVELFVGIFVLMKVTWNIL